VELPSDLTVALGKYLRVLHLIANGLALLVGEPLAERRFLSAYAARLELLERPGMYAGAVGLLGGAQVDAARLRAWVAEWDQMMQAVPTENRPLQIHPYRRKYYHAAFESLLESERPKDVLWPLLTTWQLAAKSHPRLPQVVDGWVDLCRGLGFSVDTMAERLQGLAIYLEQAEDTLRAWRAERGV